jgi:hypothetical protein
MNTYKLTDEDNDNIAKMINEYHSRDTKPIDIVTITMYGTETYKVCGYDVHIELDARGDTLEVYDNDRPVVTTPLSVFRADKLEQEVKDWIAAYIGNDNK